jgi:GH35 family endo-1,4-beta-xylanase
VLEELRVQLVSVKGDPVPCDVMYTVDRRGFPFWSEWKPEGPGEVAIRYPKTQPFEIAILWEVPGFGQVMVTADNEGKGYRLAGCKTIDFRLEAARSKVRRVRERMVLLSRSGYALAPALRRMERAEAALRLALDATQRTPCAYDRPQSETAAWADEALTEASWAGEEIELIKARQDIANMSKERRRSLLFGSTFFTGPSRADGSELFIQHFVELFDFATMPFYRGRLEPVPGKVDWEPLDRTLDWLGSKGIQAKGHPLSWYIKPAGLPRWMQKLSYCSLKEVVYRQIYQTVSRYKDRIKTWDVINEAYDPVTLDAGHLDLSRDQAIELTALACKATRDADPQAIRIVNCNKLEGYYRGDVEGREPMHAIEYLERLQEHGVEYEVLGLQMYQGATDHPMGDMASQSALIDRYIALGKPIHITEVQVPSAVEGKTSYIRLDPAEGGWWHRPWDLETQADWVEQFYTIALSKPEVQAITWWSLSDRSTFWPRGGLLDEGDQPKPSFHRLRDLIEQVRRG